LGGVLGLLFAVLFLFLFRFSSSGLYFIGVVYSVPARILFWRVVANFFLLTWLGSCPAESPYTELALFCTFIYFIFISMLLILPHAISLLYR
jgi:hypothetical protein